MKRLFLISFITLLFSCGQWKTSVLNPTKIYSIGSSADKINKFFHGMIDVATKNSLEECVISAKNEAEPGSILLLSPACASFDMFDNYEHRGSVFKEAVNKL